jgi:hypothetical protein
MLKQLKPLYLFLIFFLSAHSVSAQLEAHDIEGEGWAKGDFIEFGINSKGVYELETLIDLQIFTTIENLMEMKFLGLLQIHLLTVG